MSTVKLRQAGFQDCIDTQDMFRKWIGQLQQERVLPPVDWWLGRLLPALLLQAVTLAHELNARPRRTLGWLTPVQRFGQLVR